MTGLVRAVGRWLVDRLALGPIIDFVRHHRVPPEFTTWRGWMVVFGLSTLLVFVLQVGTGIALVSAYVPTPASAYESLRLITYETGWGGIVRALHFYGASAMVLLACAHMARVFLTGSFKFPREMQWITGVFLLFLTLAMAWTGQLLRWNQDGVWTVVVGVRFAERVPLIGTWFAEQLLGGQTVGGATLTRFFVLHVLVFPLTLAAFVTVHLYLVIANGISELPRAGRLVDRASYRAWYRTMKETVGRPYVPSTVWRELAFAAVVYAVIVLLALVLGPKPPGLPPDPTRLAADPRPDWFVVWYYALLWLKPRGAEDLFMVWMPLIAGAALLVMPLLFPGGERHPRRRPWAFPVVGTTVLVFGTLTVLGTRAPWVPVFDTHPLGAAEIGDDDPVVLRGASLFVERGCQYCHRVLGEGGTYGPDLTGVTRRLHPEEINVRIVMGIRDMPAYRDILPADELDAVLRFLDAAGRR